MFHQKYIANRTIIDFLLLVFQTAYGNHKHTVWPLVSIRPDSLRTSSLSAILGLYILPIFHLLLNLAAKRLIIIELYKSFDDFSVVCGDFIRSFVIVLFGRL